VLILAIIVLGMGLGAVAQWILGRRGSGRTDWTMAFFAGLGGSFVGGLIFSLIAGDGLALRPSGIIGSLLGAIIVTAIWQEIRRRRHHAEREAEKASYKRH
jgi:uncharacterized membrane protein YeaQ/YmgE (transglycosylase-associated protein family)